MMFHEVRDRAAHAQTPHRRAILARLRCVGVLFAVFGLLFTGSAAHARGPAPGAAAPPIKLPDLDGNPIDLSISPRQPQVVIFGDLAHPGVREAMANVVSVAAERRRAGDAVTTVLVISHNDDPAKLRADAAAGGFPSLILHDEGRRTFGAYRILVMPTVVVVDRDGKVVYTITGPVPHSKENLSAALLLCAGKLTDEQFRRAVDAEATPAEAPSAARAERLVHLGHELVRHGLYEIAESRFKEATEIAPANPEAQVGLAGVLLRTGRLDEAEAAYRAIASADKESIDAAIGLATVQALRGGDGLDKAELAASELVAKYPSLPKTRYLMGIIYERKGNCAAAVGEFKRAAELLIGD